MWGLLLVGMQLVLQLPLPFQFPCSVEAFVGADAEEPAGWMVYDGKFFAFAPDFCKRFLGYFFCPELVLQHFESIVAHQVIVQVEQGVEGGSVSFGDTGE